VDYPVRYLAEEIAEDHAAGALTRREALRRLGLMGFSAMGASALLAACGGGGGDDGDGDTATQPTDPGGTQAGGTATTRASTPVQAQDITYQGQGVQLRGVFAQAASPRGAVMVIHENMGITPFVRSLVGRLAGDGYTALAVDLLSREGGTAAFTDGGTIPAALTRLGNEFPADMRSTLDELGRRQPGARLGMTGFCFGGTQTWRMLEVGEQRLVAAVPCYGTPSDNPNFSGSRQCAVLGVYAENDARVNATREAARSALEAAGMTHEIRTFDGVGHAFIRFFEDPANAAYQQANAGYRAIVDWFGRHLR
jgi:carboxymethylenebutenolidase